MVQRKGGFFVCFLSQLPVQCTAYPVRVFRKHPSVSTVHPQFFFPLINSSQPSPSWKSLFSILLVVNAGEADFCCEQSAVIFVDHNVAI